MTLVLWLAALAVDVPTGLAILGIGVTGVHLVVAYVLEPKDQAALLLEAEARDRQLRPARHPDSPPAPPPTLIPGRGAERLM